MSLLSRFIRAFGRRPTLTVVRDSTFLIDPSWHFVKPACQCSAKEQNLPPGEGACGVPSTAVFKPMVGGEVEGVDPLSMIPDEGDAIVYEPVAQHEPLTERIQSGFNAENRRA